MDLLIGVYKRGIYMENRLLVKNILCALGIGVIINVSSMSITFANEQIQAQGNVKNKQVNNTNLNEKENQKEQLEQIKQLSQEIADINIRLNQLTESLDKYNERLQVKNENVAIIKENESLSQEDVKNFNENRKLDKKSKIVQEDDEERQQDFKKNDEYVINNIIEQDNSTDFANKADMQQDEFNDVISDFGINNKNYKINYNFFGNKKTSFNNNYNIKNEQIKQNIVEKAMVMSEESNQKVNSFADDIGSIKDNTNDSLSRDNNKLAETTNSNIEKIFKAEIDRNYMVDMDNDDIANMYDTNTISLESMNMLDRFNIKAPVWTYKYFDRLAQEGLLYPDEDFNLNSLTRREGAILTARSYNLNKIKQRRQQYETNVDEPGKNNFIHNDINILMKEYAVEIKALGYDIVSDVSDTKIKYKQDYEWKFGGEIRYNYANNSGAKKYDWNDSRLRFRLYGEKALSEDWILHTMIESDKSFIDDSIYTNERNGDIDLSRIYLEANQVFWGIPFNFELGKTYAYLADGNVLDSDFEGIKISSNATPNTEYTVGYGEVNDTENMIYGEILNRNKNYDYLLGFYKWDNYGDPNTIKALGMNYYTGNYTLGGMYLTSDLKDGSGADDGYVLSARYGKNLSWIPHTFEFGLKYYNMAGETYINHTMSGLGSYMNGFSGWGAMSYYTLAENIVLGLEYYDLKDKTTDEKAKTTWISLSYSF